MGKHPNCFCRYNAVAAILEATVLRLEPNWLHPFASTGPPGVDPSKHRSSEAQEFFATANEIQVARNGGHNLVELVLLTK